MAKMTARATSLLGDEEGAVMSEYALLAVLIAVAAVAGVTSLGKAVNNLFTTASGSF